MCDADPIASIRMVLDGDRRPFRKDQNTESTVLHTMGHVGCRSRSSVSWINGYRKHWHKLDRYALTTIIQAAAELAATIQHKATIPPAQRPTLVLAVNALDTPGHALSAVVDICRRTYGAEFAALSFSAIWIVGPTVTLILRVD